MSLESIQMQNQYEEERLIIWQKWFDPFGEDDPENPATSLEEHQDSDDLLLDDETTDSYNESIISNPGKPIKAIATPMGLIPYNENTASSKIFNFWVGHTNFSITRSIANVLEQIDGIETLDIFTRYRFRISIGKAFDASKVLKKINDIIYAKLENDYEQYSKQ